MSTGFIDDAAELVRNAPAPDAEAVTIKELGDMPRKRGRPPKSGGVAPQKKNVKQKNPQEFMDFETGAKAINTAVFATACAFCGTSEAWPEVEREKVMDLALTRYLALKNVNIPAEFILLGAYAKYFGEVATNPKVQENFAVRFSFLKKVKFLERIGNWFSSKKKIESVSEEKKGWLR